MKTLISIDPGMSSGIIIGTYSDDTPFELTHAFQLEEGVTGFLDRVTHYTCSDGFSDAYGETYFGVRGVPGFRDDYSIWYENESPVFLMEKFTARGGGNSGFSYRTKDLEPIRVEGAIQALKIPVETVSPSQQYAFGGKTLAERRKRQHSWLKDHGYYISPKQVGCKDANDARSAAAHAISWLKRKRHKPTLDMFKSEDNDD